jgi:hypothetical protein
VVTHRYLGIVVGLLMLVWFASGVVMLFVHWPELTEDERRAALEPIPWARCCNLGAGLAEHEIVESARIEALGGRPVLRLPDRVVDLESGRPLAPLTTDEAWRVAEGFGRRRGVAGKPVRASSMKRDQWTVTGYFNSRRPFWRIAFDDAPATHVHVSARTGEVAQVTTRAERILNWLGPIPHWLYPTILRQDVRLWTQVVIWTSSLGLFLTVTGVYLGLVAWRPWRDGRLSPYRGLMLWHHLVGLAAGALTLTWTLSGLLSMQPWGLLESRPDERGEAYAASSATGRALAGGLAALKAQAPPTAQVRLTVAAGEPRLFTGAELLDLGGARVRLASADLARAGRSLGGVARQGLIHAEDAYYYGHHTPVTLPVWRVILKDGTRYYLRPETAEIVATADAAAKGFRWWHLGLHRLDVVPGFDRGLGWASAMTVLLLFAGVGVGTGVWLGWRRLQADLAGIKTKAPKLG